MTYLFEGPEGQGCSTILKGKYMENLLVSMGVFLEVQPFFWFRNFSGEDSGGREKDWATFPFRVTRRAAAAQTYEQLAQLRESIEFLFLYVSEILL